MVRKKKLQFKKEYGKGIVSGAKTSTIRLNSSLREGDVVIVFAGNEKLGVARIEKVEVKKVRDLNHEDAVRDGFRSREELLAALKKIYGSRISDKTEVKLIRFRMVSRERKD